MPRPDTTINILSNWYSTVFCSDTVYTEQMKASLNKWGATTNVTWNTPLIQTILSHVSAKVLQRKEQVFLSVARTLTLSQLCDPDPRYSAAFVI